MTVNSNIRRSQQSLTPGAAIHLYELDFSSIPNLLGTGYGSLYRFCSSADVATQQVSFGGNIYTTIEMESEGFESSGKGRLPTPRIRISNVALWGSTLINALGDPYGARVTRYMTFDCYLDDGSTPDSEAVFLPQIFLIERKTAQNKRYIEFELSASIDQEGRMLPGRQILRDACTHVYRRWDATAGEFDYSQATCPYVGSDTLPGGEEGPYYTDANEPTSDPAEDVASKSLDCCKVRFQSLGLPLPTRAFPGVAKIRGRR